MRGVLGCTDWRAGQARIGCQRERWTLHPCSVVWHFLVCTCLGDDDVAGIVLQTVAVFFHFECEADILIFATVRNYDEWFRSGRLNG